MSGSDKPRRKLRKAAPLTPQGDSPPANTPAPESKAPVAKVPQASQPASPGSAVERYRARHRTSIWTTLLLLVFLAAMFLGLGGVAFVMLRDKSVPLAFEPIGPQTVDEMSEVAVTVKAAAEKTSEGELSYRMTKGPEGAQFDSSTGQFTWTPTEEQGPGSFPVAIEVTSTDPNAIPAIARFGITVKEVNQPPEVKQIADQKVFVGKPLTLGVEARDTDLPAKRLGYSIAKGREHGALLDRNTGQFRWTPRPPSTPTSKPQVYEFTIEVTELGRRGTSVTPISFKVEVSREPSAIDHLIAELRQAGHRVDREGSQFYPFFAGSCHLLSLNGLRVRVFEYETAKQAADDATKVSPDASTLFGKEHVWEDDPHLYHKEGLIALYTGTDAKVLDPLAKHFGRPFAEGKAVTVTLPKAKPIQPDDPEVKQLVELYTKNKRIFIGREYPTLRKIFADRFARVYAEQIKVGLGAEYDAMMSWFDEHPVIKEELYVAIDPRYDRIETVLALFRDLKKTFPKDFERYANLAIAVSVTWDNVRGVYEYANHQRRTHAVMPEDLIGALDNYKYFVEAERAMGGRARHLPWEFLIHLVNHKSPVGERKWALSNYLHKRVMFGKCYSEVPYDHVMLETQSKQCKLDGKPYTLANIRALGGVCAMQADFAARVGKSLGVPAEYVWGESRYGDLHAWVMWVELLNVTEKSITFSLQSHGRYRGDKYYIGKLREPQTGQQITDRELELRLHTVGVDYLAKRQAELVMAAFPLIRDKLKLDVDKQLVYLNQVTTLSPGNEEAWYTIAKMSRDGVITNKHLRRLKQATDRMFLTLANFPDFTWKVFDDLIAYYEKPRDINSLYGRLIGLYVKAKRPDLACEARLKFTEYLLKQEKPEEAMNGLAATIQFFPDEGRYVPRMLDRLESIAADVKGADAVVTRFYKKFLQRIPQMRGDSPSKFCIEMFQRGIERFKKAGDTIAAQQAEAELAKIKAGMGRRSKS